MATTKPAKEMTPEEVSATLTQGYQSPNPSGTSLTRAAGEFLMGTVWTSDLSWREKRLVSLTCTAIAGHAFPLEVHLYAALKSGDFTLAEIQAWALHLAAYAGFPVGAGVETVLTRVRALLDEEGVQYGA